jgi:hypothetical protein
MILSLKPGEQTKVLSMDRHQFTMAEKAVK